MKLKRLILLLSAQLICVFCQSTTEINTAPTTLGSGVPVANEATTELTTGIDAPGAGESSVVDAISNQASSSSAAEATSDQAVSSAVDLTSNQVDSPAADATSNQVVSSTANATSNQAVSSAADATSNQAVSSAADATSNQAVSSAADATSPGVEATSTQAGAEGLEILLTDDIRKLLEKHNLPLETVMKAFPQINEIGDGSVSLPTSQGEQVTVTFKETESEPDRSNQETSTTSETNAFLTLKAIMEHVQAGDSETKAIELEHLKKQMDNLGLNKDGPDGGPKAMKNTLRTVSTKSISPKDTVLPVSSSNDVTMRVYSLYKENVNKLQENERQNQILLQRLDRGEISPQFYTVRSASLMNIRRRLFLTEAFFLRRYPSLPRIYAYEQTVRRLPSRDSSLRGNLPRSFVPGIGSSGLSRFNNFRQFRHQLRNQVASSSTRASNGLMSGTVTGFNVPTDLPASATLTQISNAPDFSGSIPGSIPANSQQSTLDILRDVEATVGSSVETGDPDLVINRIVWDNFYNQRTSSGSTLGGTGASATSGMLPASSSQNIRMSPNFRLQNSRRFTMLPAGRIMRPRFMHPARLPFVALPPRGVF